jgi:23S rRNA (adenine1618-N6)-methyltransferase
MTIKETTTEKPIYIKSQHRLRYDFSLLIKTVTDLKLCFINDHDIETIDFSKPKAVKTLNNALLISYYG